LKFTRVGSKGGYYIYGAGISNGNINITGNKYVFVYVKMYMPDVPQSGSIYELPWSSVSTRILKVESYPLKKQVFKLVMPTLDPICELIERHEHDSIYHQQELDIEITMLHDPKKKTKYQYYNKIRLLHVIESFKCIIQANPE